MKAILFVDDHEVLARLSCEILEMQGYKAVSAYSAKEALEKFSQQDFDILVTDVMMPQMTGDELARRLRAQHPTLKVLYLTGFSDRLFMEKVTLWADEAFLDKPCSVKGLLEAVALLLFGRFDMPPDFVA